MGIFSPLHCTEFPVQLNKFTVCNKIDLTADSVWWRLHAAFSWCPWLLQHRRPWDLLYTNTSHTYMHTYILPGGCSCSTGTRQTVTCWFTKYFRCSMTALSQYHSITYAITHAYTNTLLQRTLLLLLVQTNIYRWQLICYLLQMYIGQLIAGLTYIFYKLT